MKPSRSRSRCPCPGTFCVLLAALAAGPASGDDLGTDRDAFTPSSHVVEPGSLLHEASYVFIDNPVGLPTNNYPEWLLRIGGNEWFEWRFGVNYGVGSQGTIVTSVEVGEGTLDGSRLYETSILYGLKLQLSRQAGWQPEAAFIMEASTPAFGDSFGTVPVATGVAGWELPGGWRFDAALRYAYAEGHQGWFSRWSPSAVLRMPVTDRWEVHAEWFGSYSAGLTPPRSQPFFSPGTHYLLGRTMEIGLRVGWGLGGAAAPFFSDAGLGWRW